MNIIKLSRTESSRTESSKLEKPENYDEMKEFFDKRTNSHIGMVKKYCKKIEEYDNKE